MRKELYILTFDRGDNIPEAYAVMIVSSSYVVSFMPRDHEVFLKLETNELLLQKVVSLEMNSFVLIFLEL